MRQTFCCIGLRHEAFWREATLGVEVIIVPAQVLGLVIGSSFLIAIKFLQNVKVQIYVQV